MPRYRKLHCKITESLDVNDMPDDFTRLFWVLLPTALCREGRGLDNAAWLKSRLFPLREDIDQGTVYAAFAWCVDRGMIAKYTVGERDYFLVPTFHQYQGNTIKEAESDYPPPPVQTNSRVSPELVQSKSATDAVFNIQYSDANADSDDLGATAPPESSNGGGSSADYQEMRLAWAELFPKKPQPRENNQTLQGKVRTRMRSEHFRDNWLAALQRGARSKFLRDSPWFDFSWFVRNDDHYERCLNGKYDDTAPIHKRSSDKDGKSVADIMRGYEQFVET